MRGTHHCATSSPLTAMHPIFRSSDAQISRCSDSNSPPHSCTSYPQEQHSNVEGVTDLYLRKHREGFNNEPQGSYPIAGRGIVHRYCRADVLRILHITAQQLAGWEKAGLIAASETYSFIDLLQIKKVRDLRP